MAQTTHKSATSVTLAPLAEKSPFERVVQKYWIHALVIAAAISAWVIFRFQSGQAEKQVRDQSWDTLISRTTPAGFPAIPSADASVFESLASELKDRPVAPWARWLEAKALVEKRDYSGARGTLEKLRTEFPTHELAVGRWNFGGAAAETPIEYLLRTLDARAAWEQQHPQLFANPAIPADAVRVRLKTDKGDVVLALYPSAAPKHVEAFLANVDGGLYSGTKFHHIDQQLGVDGGDPGTVSGDPASWGQGGKDQLVPFEESKLYHFEGALSAAQGNAPKESLGSQFSILTAVRHDLDGQRVVFGVVESGLEVVKQIAAGDIDPNTPGRPLQPVTISSVERL